MNGIAQFPWPLGNGTNGPLSYNSAIIHRPIRTQASPSTIVVGATNVVVVVVGIVLPSALSSLIVVPVVVIILGVAPTIIACWLVVVVTSLPVVIICWLIIAVALRPVIDRMLVVLLSITPVRRSLAFIALFGPCRAGCSPALGFIAV